MNTFEKENQEYWLKISVGLGAVVYLMVLIFAASHNINLMTIGVTEGFRWLAFIGVAGLILNSIAFPLGLHFWAYERNHRMALILFYALDIALLAGNSWADWHLVQLLASGESLPVITNAYLDFIAPFTPLVVLVVWAVLFVLDPRSRKRAEMARIKAHTEKQMALNIANMLNDPAHLKMVESAAVAEYEAMMEQIVPMKSPHAPSGLNGGGEAQHKATLKK